MRKIVFIIGVCLLLSGCATWKSPFKEWKWPFKSWQEEPKPWEEPLKMAMGTSTKAVEEARPHAIAKIYPYDYSTTYARVERLLGKMPRVKIYAKTREMIALYYIDPNTTPVGVFFTEKGPSLTRVAVSSPGPDAREWVAKNVFSQTVLPATPDTPKF